MEYQYDNESRKRDAGTECWDREHDEQRNSVGRKKNLGQEGWKLVGYGGGSIQGESRTRRIELI